ncbi:hypothetical protein OIDMADRAFT_182346 [Oidiodendron maius Zn]|uniref:DUF202 domain-containing protein n=1 Tax=Oidiodendron maius (strain Zn) TaxID=913774 RepID=A0A0C3D7W9_OIDMZ|nr:hypothetical protein OIDMADRAFT_182346 [Oidiodendron maius Zn]
MPADLHDPVDMPETSDRDPVLPAADAREREATELAGLRRQYSRASSYRRQGQGTTSREPETPFGRFAYNTARFWSRQVSVIVPHEACRDHLALERTFLGYLRTSLALSMLGITIAQLFRLQHTPHPSAVFGFFVLGKPLSCICQGAAIFTLAMGTFRTWRSQNAIVRGKAISGGFEIVSLTAGIFIILLVLFVLMIAVDIDKEDVASHMTLLINRLR